MLALITLLSCTRGTVGIPDDELALTLTGPEYGVFAGGDTIRVTGSVFPNRAVVTIEGREVVVGTDGGFDVEVPIAGAYRNIDVRAYYREQQLRERVPVFSGDDPLDTWPGGIGVRLTPRLFRPLADQLAAAVDDADWESQLLAQIPSVETDAFWLIPTRLSHRPAEAWLTPDDDGLLLEIRLRDLLLELDAGFVIAESTIPSPARIGWEELTLSARVNLFVDPTGVLRLTTSGADVALTDPVIELGTFDLGLLDFVLDFVGGALTGIGDFALDLVLGLVGGLPLSGPIEQEIDLLGTPLVVSLADLGIDPEGVFLDLGMGIGGPAQTGTIPRPTLEDGRPGADVIIAVHEGLFAPLLESDLLDLLSQDLELNGFLGSGAGLIFQNLPRGGEAPPADGWCIRVDPGAAKVVRLNPDLDALASIYLPDLRLNVAVSHDGIRCDPWLEASLATTATLGLEDLALDIGLSAPDGYVAFYAVEGEYDEQEVIQGLTSLFDLLIGFAGSALQIDLADLLGGGGIPGLEDAELTVTGAFPIERDGEPVPGLVAIGLDVL